MSILNKISQGKWGFSPFGRGKFQQQLESSKGGADSDFNKIGIVDFSYLNEYSEAEANFKAIKAIPEMLSIIESLSIKRTK
jgi:hypothetical protein